MKRPPLFHALWFNTATGEPLCRATATELRDRVLSQLNGGSRELSAADRERQERLQKRFADALRGARKGRQ